MDNSFSQITSITSGQFQDAPDDVEENKNAKNLEVFSSIFDSKGFDSNALCGICQQKRDERFMICCDSCKEWFHVDCVGISETQAREMEKESQEYICLCCNTKKQTQLQSQFDLQPDPELIFPECLTLSPPSEQVAEQDEEQFLKSVVVEELEEGNKEMEQAAVTEPEPEPETVMETDTSAPLCIGPNCSRQPLPDSVYCGTDCILQHAAATVKTLSGPKVPKSKARAQRKTASTRSTEKAQRSGRASKKLEGKAEQEGEDEQMIGVDEEQEAATSFVPCDPSLTEVQAPSTPSSKFYTACMYHSILVHKQTVFTSFMNFILHICIQTLHFLTKIHKNTHYCTYARLPITKEKTQSESQEVKEPVDGVLPKEQSTASQPSQPPTPAKSNSLSSHTISNYLSSKAIMRLGALIVRKTAYVIPRSSLYLSPLQHVPASSSGKKPSSAPTKVNETRNLLVPPAQAHLHQDPPNPNNQVRQSIQRSLTSILFKRVCDCQDLELTENETAKLVASIEMEMFDIFRNTDSKYMNKYRTIMFNLKDPKNKGLLYRVVRGEISPFRLVRMSQKDMQAIKAPEPSLKQTEAKNAPSKPTSLMKPEAVKVDLPSMNPVRPERKPENVEQKKSLPAPAVKTRPIQPVQGSAVPDILSCMLKDTTSEHKAHLFDLKCKICTGQILATEDGEPAKKKPKLSVSKEKNEPLWKKMAGDDSPLRAPPDSPDMDSPTYSLKEPSLHFNLDSPTLTIVESPASPTMDSPASPTLESPASPIMESPASPTPETSKATAPKKAYTPVMIPAVSTVTITRRDPRTAASRFSASLSSMPGPSNTCLNQAAPYAPIKETAASHMVPATVLPPSKPLPKSILMKPSSKAEPRLYGTSSRRTISDTPADSETTQFLSKQDILWKGFLNMLTVAKFVTKGYLVSGSAENLKADLPDTIQIGGRIMPETVWDYVAKLKTSVTKELCVIRFHSSATEEGCAYISLFSYFSHRGRFGVIANGSRSIKDVYLVPLSAKEPIPSILQPLEGPDPIVQQYGQKSKVQEIEELETDFDRPYDPEEEYDPAMGYETAASKKSSSRPTLASHYYSRAKRLLKPLLRKPFYRGRVVSAATLSEQQRMLEELNKQIEEQKRQLKEQEEALRQQREAVGMFMAQFTVSDSLMPPPQKSLPLSQLSSLQKSMIQTESKPTESTERQALLSQSWIILI
ncbi:LOW QUALITY PROTEIN: death-inducer obliterator 1 [Pholidichthys leucotaenia]